MISVPQLRRVLMTADTVGGVWNYSIELCRGLGRHGVDVVLATMGPPPSPAQRQELDALANVTLCESTHRLEWMDDPWADVERAGSWLLELESKHAPDLVHLNGYAHGALPWNVPHLIVAHSCVLSWWRAVHHEPAPAAWDQYRENVRRGLAATPLVVAPTRAMADALAEHGADPIKVIPNGRDPWDDIRTPNKEPFILSVGRMWDAAKNGQALAAVAPQLEWPIRVAGETRGPEGAHLPLPGVEQLGRCSPAQLAELYRRASIFALPARYEPFGLSVLEAGLAGCALVLGDIPSLRELWDDAAAFVPPVDTRALARVLDNLIRTPALLRQQAAAAKDRARRYSAARMILSYLDAYRRLLSPGVLAPALRA